MHIVTKDQSRRAVAVNKGAIEIDDRDLLERILEFRGGDLRERITKIRNGKEA